MKILKNGKENFKHKKDLLKLNIKKQKEREENYGRRKRREENRKKAKST